MPDQAHAVVLGASVAGLLAAQVLRVYYDEVTVIERDELPQAPVNRRGVPQGRHGHTLLPGGCQALGRLLPDLLDELEAAGVPVVNEPGQLYFAPGGRPLRLGPGLGSELRTYVPSRPQLEWQVRRQVTKSANVRVLEHHEAVGLITDGSARRVAGVQIAGPGPTRSLPADLVVDARGRGAGTPAWLEQLAFARPPTQRVGVDTRYATHPVRIPGSALPERLVLVGAHAGCHRGLGLFGHEADTWDFTVFGVRGQRPPTEPDAMVDYVAGLIPPHIVEALRSAQSMGSVRSYHFPASRWCRYDTVRLPEGLLLVGDAVCSLNPVYGQGMTLAALQVETLAACLAADDVQSVRSFHAAAALPISWAWELAQTGDRAHDNHGTLSIPERLDKTATRMFMRAATHDAVLTDRFLRVLGMLEPPRLLQTPSSLLRIVRGNLMAGS